MQKKISDYLTFLAGIGIAGFRIDAAKHIWPADLYNITKKFQHLRKCEEYWHIFRSQKKRVNLNFIFLERKTIPLFIKKYMMMEVVQLEILSIPHWVMSLNLNMVMH